jgi:anthranilate phosphoribosyltransferase
MNARELLALVAANEPLSQAEARAAIGGITQGTWAEAETAALLTALHLRGETVDELVGAAAALREQMRPAGDVPPGLLDTCGTGGDGSGTFNVSTAAALVVAGCGVPVAKHGNRSFSSSTGSADVLEALGVNLEAAPDVVLSGLREVGLAFFFGPLWHPAVGRVAAVRRLLPFRTLFNLLGPLCNPAGAEYQLVGTGRRQVAEKLAQALGQLGARAAVVCGEDGLDEVTLSGRTFVYHVVDGRIERLTWRPEDFGLPWRVGNPWLVSSAAESATVITSVLRGQAGPSRDLVLANAAAALWAAGRVADVKAGVELAAEAVDGGAAEARLEGLIRWTNGPAPASA